MRHIVPIIILCLHCFCSVAQPDRQHIGQLDIHSIRWGYDSKYPKHIVNHQSGISEWESVQLSKAYTVLKKTDGTQYYAGGVDTRTILEGEKGKETVNTILIKSGTGVLKTIYPNNTEYISGTWKKDLLSGDALIRDTSGTVFFCSWKRGKVIIESRREATETEKEKLQKDIKSFEAKIVISGI